MAVLKLSAGFAFNAWTRSNGGARNWAELFLMRGGQRTDLAPLGPNEPKTSYPVVFSDAELHVVGFAGFRVKSRKAPFKDKNNPIEVIYYDDAYGNDSDYDDLIVFIERVKMYSPLSMRVAATSGAGQHASRLGRLALSVQDCVDQLTAVLGKIDRGDPVSASDYSDLPIIRERLNGAEKELFDQDPIVGARVLLHAEKAVDTANQSYVAECSA